MGRDDSGTKHARAIAGEGKGWINGAVELDAERLVSFPANMSCHGSESRQFDLDLVAEIGGVGTFAAQPVRGDVPHDQRHPVAAARPPYHAPQEDSVTLFSRDRAGRLIQRMFGLSIVAHEERFTEAGVKVW